MDTKGWLIGMGWMVLCSTNLVFASESEHSNEEARHSDRDKGSNDLASPLPTLEDGECGNYVDLTPLYSALLDDETRDYAMGKGDNNYYTMGHSKEKWQRFLLRSLREYLFSLSDEEFSNEEFSDEEEAEAEKDSHNGENGDEDIMEKVFPTATALKKRYSPEELRQMDIDLDRLLKIELFLILPLSRPFIPKEESLLNEAILSLNPSLDQCLLDTIEKDPERQKIRKLNAKRRMKAGQQHKKRMKIENTRRINRLKDA
jgi:hypothetical protein